MPSRAETRVAWLRGAFAGGAAMHWALPLAAALFSLVLIPPGMLPYPQGADVSDAALAHWPAAHFLKQSVWEHGQWPLWNPDRMLGQPFAANPLNKVWYPPQWLVLALPVTLHLNLMIAIHIGWLAAGALAWARAERLHPLAGALLSAGLTLNPKLLAHLAAGHLDIVYALAWAPWCLWAAARLIDRADPQRALLLGGSAALLALADLRVAIYAGALTALYGLVLAWERRALTWALLRMGGLAALLVLLLTAVQTVPLFALSGVLTRGALTPEDAAALSLPPGYLAGLLFPDPGGFHEWMTYTGLPVLLLAPFALRPGVGRVRVSMALAGAALLALLWSLGSSGPIFMPAVRALPLMAWLRVPPRALFIFEMALNLLAAIGLDGLLRAPAGSTARLAAAGAAGGGVLLMIMGAVGPVDVVVRGSLLTAGLWLAVSGMGLWLACSARERLVLPGGVVLAASLALALGSEAVHLIDARAPGATETIDAALLERIEPCGRVYSPSFMLTGVRAAQARIPTLHAVDPFQIGAARDLIAAASGADYDGYSVVVPPLPPVSEQGTALALRDAALDGAMLGRLGVGWAASAFPLEGEMLRLDWRGDGVYLYRLEAGRAPLTITPGCGVEPNQPVDTLSGAGDGNGSATLAVMTPYLPGWRARINGQRVPVKQGVDGLVRIDLPPGAGQHVELLYRPVADYAGMAITGITLAIVWRLTDPSRGRRRG